MVFAFISDSFIHRYHLYHYYAIRDIALLIFKAISLIIVSR